MTGIDERCFITVIAFLVSRSNVCAANHDATGQSNKKKKKRRLTRIPGGKPFDARET
jgi:hypothetical protein